MRDLAGWCLAVLLWSYPAILLGTFVGWMDGDLYGFAFFLTLLGGFAWPGFFLLSRRLRQPDDLDVAEADGRPPVLVVHAFERTATPIWRRLFPTPAFFRDLSDELLVRALRKGMAAAGPVVFVERPAAPPSHGPMALMHEGHQPHLDHLLLQAKAAQLVVVVLDGTETMRHELGHLAETVDLRRLVLVVNPRARDDFFEQWARFRLQLPGLPALDPRTAAVRFAADGTPTILGAVASSAPARRSALAQPAVMLRASEIAPVPAAPSWSWFLTGLLGVMGLVSAVITPVFQEEHGVRMSSSDTTAFAFITVFVGILLAISSRRVMRLVPGGELPLVILASGFWLFGAAYAATKSDDLWGVMGGAQQAAAFAAWSAPLLWAVAIVLAGASLMRASPGRRVSFGLFGFAVTVPFLSLVFSLDPTADIGGLVLATLATGFALALATIAASGDAGRAHAPLSIASAVCATLALAAWTTTVVFGEWRSALAVADYERNVRLGEHLAPLLAFDRLWFPLLLPLPLVSLVGLVFRGRATKTAVASSAALLFLALLPTATVSLDARAQSILAGRGALGEDAFLAVAGPSLVPGFELASVHGEGVYGPADMVLDRGGALSEHRRLSSELELASFGSMGTPELSRAVGDRLRAREERDEVRIAVAPDVAGVALVTACRVAWAQGAQAVVVGEEDGVPSGVRVRPQTYFEDPREPRIHLFIVVHPDRAEVADTAGNLRTVQSDARGVPRFEELEGALRERLQLEPNRRDITVVTEGGPTAQAAATALSAAYQAGFDIIMLDDHPL